MDCFSITIAARHTSRQVCTCADAGEFRPVPKRHSFKPFGEPQAKRSSVAENSRRSEIAEHREGYCIEHCLAAPVQVI
jgi:hypothetical protein